MPDPIVWSIAWPYLFAAWLFGYLLGSTPFGLILTRMAGLGDVRDIGSGNIGATNVLRTGNRKIAALTLLADLLKGTVAVVIAANWGPDQAVMAGFGAFLGHLFPLWLRFRGGKGVATYIGVLLGLSIMVGNFWPVAVFALTWLATAAIFRISSLAALVAMIVTPLFIWWLGLVQEAELMGLLSAISIAKHYENIIRMIKGSESRIGSKG
ncbi:MAG: glycerol-3-phosphate 1-O-acyltransferase PlsY [Rhodobacteraceae bacterium]|nr:glycerol-3-phosphate 1-O-acyltransferase PlsY [Paracoccaceae bacterium]